MPDLMDGQGKWYESFRAQITAKTGTTPIIYTWEELQLDNTGEWAVVAYGRTGEATEINNTDIDVTDPKLVRMEFKGTDPDTGDLTWEFEWNESGLTVEDDDGTPSYDGIHTIQFDQDDGFSISNPSAGVVKVDYGIKVEDDDGTPSYTGIHTVQFDQDDGFVITNPSAGVVKIDYGIKVEDDDGTPSYTGIHTLQFDQDDGFSLSNPSAGVAKVDFTGGAGLSSDDVALGGSAVDLAADLPGTTDYTILTLTLPSAGDYLIIAHGWGTLDSTLDNGSYLEVKLKDESAFVGTGVQFLSNSSDGNVPAIASFSVHLLYTAAGEQDITLHGIITVQDSDTINTATIDDARMSYVRLGD